MMGDETRQDKTIQISVCVNWILFITQILHGLSWLWELSWYSYDGKDKLYFPLRGLNEDYLFIACKRAREVFIL